MKRSQSIKDLLLKTFNISLAFDLPLQWVMKDKVNKLRFQVDIDTKERTDAFSSQSAYHSCPKCIFQMYLRVMSPQPVDLL